MQNNAPGLQPEPPASRRDSATRYQLAEATAAAVSPSAPIGSIGVGLEGNGEKKRVGSKDNSEGAVSPSSRRYIPQFSASTEMILSRINGKAGSLSSALSDVSAMAGNIEQAALEDTKRRLIMSMNTTATLQVPPLKTAQTASNSASALSKVEDLGPFQLRDAPLGQSLPQQDSLKVPAKRGRPARGANTKRTKSEGTETPGTDSASVDDSKRTAAADTTPTMTKSGRQVQKPTQYFPPASSSTSSSQKRKQHQGKRTAEQALCKVCTRGLSPAKNQIVFCDGCNACWHQLCHEPQIDHDYVSDQSRSWFCHRCLAKKERSGARRKAADPKTADLRAAEHKTAVHPKVISWKDKSNEQKRALLASLPHHQLVDFLMQATERHPDVPFLAELDSNKGPASSSSHDLPRETTAGSNRPSSARASQPPLTPSTPVGAPITRFEATPSEVSSEVQGQAAVEVPAEPIPPAWPKVGQGCLAGMDIKEDDLQDKNDFEAFSLTSYNAAGRKIRENGVAISTPVKAIILKRSVA